MSGSKILPHLLPCLYKTFSSQEYFNIPFSFFFYSVFSSEGSSTYTVFECDLQITEGQEEGEVRGDRDRESKTSLNTILKFLGTMVE